MGLHVCVGSLRLLQLPPAALRHAVSEVRSFSVLSLCQISKLSIVYLVSCTIVVGDPTTPLPVLIRISRREWMDGHKEVYNFYVICVFLDFWLIFCLSPLK